MRTNAKRLVSRTLRAAAIHARLLEALAVCVMISFGAVMIAKAFASAPDITQRSPGDTGWQSPQAFHFGDSISTDVQATKQQIRKLLLPSGDMGGYENSWGDTLNKAEAGGDAFHTYATKMQNFYTADARLLPTVGAGVWTKGNIVQNCPGPNGPAVDTKIGNYFKCLFLPKKPKLIAVKNDHVTLVRVGACGNALCDDGNKATCEDESSPVCYDCDANIAIHEGLYVFLLKSDDPNKKYTVYARFTYVWEKTNANPDWTVENSRILHHHSSGEPGKQCADMTGDGVVDWDDMVALIGKWGKCPCVEPCDNTEHCDEDDD